MSTKKQPKLPVRCFHCGRWFEADLDIEKAKDLRVSEELQLRDEERMSLRAVAKKMGISHSQVDRDLKEHFARAGTKRSGPDFVIGLDNKKHPARKR